MRTVSKDQNDSHRYDDLLKMSHHESGNHPHMSMAQRAAQFAPFAALTGYDEAIRESSRETRQRIELSEEEEEQLSQKLLILSRHEKEKPEVTVTWFEEDPYKAGGSYRQENVQIRKVDRISGNLILADRQMIPIQDIVALESSLFEEE